MSLQSIWKTSTCSVVNLKKKHDLDELLTWAHGMGMWYWSADSLFHIRYQLTITWMSHIKEVHSKPRLLVLSTYWLEYGRHLARLRCRRRNAYAPTSNTASHNNHEKINSWVSFTFLHCSSDISKPKYTRNSCQPNMHIRVCIYPHICMHIRTYGYTVYTCMPD